MRKDHLRARVYSTLVMLSLFLSAPAGVLGSWGLEVGRANTGDVIRLQRDWLNFKRGRERLDLVIGAEGALAIERQRQLLGVEGEGLSLTELFDKLLDWWFDNLLGPLQSIAQNPAASCAEAQFAMAEMIGIRRQQQLLGLEEREVFTGVYEATEEMVSLRCRNEALDECVATGRFMQILQLMAEGDRQTDLLGRSKSVLEKSIFESWAEDALGQCAIYELHFVSRTTIMDSGLAGPVEIETVRDGTVHIKFEIPPSGLKGARASLGDLLKGKNEKSPFFASIKCKAPQPSGVPLIEMICSPGADSSPVKVAINALDLKHREFYIEYERDKRLPFTFKETEVSKERVVGEDKFSFEFEGGEFNLQGLIKVEGETVEVPMPGVGISFYLAHKKDQTASGSLKIENTMRGVYPTIFHFTYAGVGDTDEAGVLSTDSTDFELIHKPKPKPFEKVPEPIRKPLKPPPGE